MPTKKISCSDAEKNYELYPSQLILVQKKSAQAVWLITGSNVLGLF